MSRFQRDKGARGERELARILSDKLGEEVVRNLMQTREGGHDLNGVPFALEVKRQETLAIDTWWEQATRQAEQAGLPPALAYRPSRRPWRFRVRLCDVNSDLTGEETADVDLDGFCLLVRERIAA